MERNHNAPAIVRSYSDPDREAEVTHTFYDSVSFVRGLGDSGYKLQIVEHECPHQYCRHDRMVRRLDVRPEERDAVRYWCLNPACIHHVGTQFRYARTQAGAHEPTVYDDE